MKRSWIALTLAAAMLLALLSGCGKPKKQQADEFYDLWEEIKGVQDGEVNLTMPWHTATLTAAGFFTRTERMAELTVSLTDKEGQTREWTQLRAVDNELWLNVGELAETTLTYPLIPARQEEIRELQATQTAPWMNYTWEGDLWAGIPAWKTLLSQFWQDSREDLSGFITAEGGNTWTLELKGSDLEQTGGKVAQRLLDQKEAYAQGFLDSMEEQQGLTFAVPTSMMDEFNQLWNTVLRQSGAQETETDELIDLDGDQDQQGPGEDEIDPFADDQMVLEEEPATEQEPLKAVKLRLSRLEKGYSIELLHNDKQVFLLTLIPAQGRSTQAPEEVMSFDQYYNDVYLMVKQSKNHVADALDGTQPETLLGEEAYQDEEDTEPLLYPLTTLPAGDSEGIALIQYLGQNGEAQMVPVLTGYVANDVSSVNGDGEMVTELSLYHPHWDLQVYTLEAKTSPQEDVAEEIQEYYDIYIQASGYQVMEEISQVSSSGDGTSAAQGFSYQENPFTSALSKLMVLIRQKDAAAYTVLDLKLDLDQMTEGERSQLQELFRYLDLEIPVQLVIE